MFSVCVCLFWVALVGGPFVFAFYVLRRHGTRSLTLRALMTWVASIGLMLAGFVATPPPPNCSKGVAVGAAYLMPFVFLALYVPSRLAGFLAGLWLVAFAAWLLSPAI